jgi:hypothetical protein
VGSDLRPRGRLFLISYRTALTEFVYRREVQPQRKLGAWIETLTAILEAGDKLPGRERRSRVRLFEELRGRGYDGA